MKLLIAEDDYGSRNILEKAALEWGYEIISVEDGEAAWEVLQQADPPKLLLLNWTMPRLSGLDLCQRIRENESDDTSFIILLSSRTSSEDIVTGLNAGSNEYITKPFDLFELQARLQVGRRRLEVEARRQKNEEDNTRLQRALQKEKKMDALGQISGDFAHDFNNILGIIMGYTNMALDRFGNDIPEKLTAYLKTVSESSERAKDLVAELTVFSQTEVESNLINLNTDMTEELERINDVLPAGVKIEFSAEDNLPPILIEVDKFQKLLTTLCDNANHAMLNSGTITVTAKLIVNTEYECSDCHKLLDGDWVELSVSDTCGGMTAEEIEDSYEPFYIKKSASKDYEKALGMFYSLLCRHGRHSVVESEVNKGTTVSIFFPIQN